MATIVISGLALSLVIYLLIGLNHSKHVKDLADIIPLLKNRTAKVKSTAEFSSSTVATSISLATVIVAFFELVPSLGMWLIWPAVTTGLGFWLFAKFSKAIWDRMSLYEHRPTLHEFLGTEYSSEKLSLIGAVFTTLGYLSAFAVELTVGSRFLSAMIPGISEWITVIIISGVSFIYTSMGGFRTVIVTDRIQMNFIWLLLIALLGYYGFNLMAADSLITGLSKIPNNIILPKWSSALIPFILGILIMNLFTFISNMALWQRIAGAQEPETVIKGMKKAIYQSLLSWALFAIVAVGAFIVVTPIEGENLLITVLHFANSSLLGKVVIFFVTLGLYGAMLSTASTQLIAVSHTIYEDIISQFRVKTLNDRISSKKELVFSRFILIISAILAIGVVEFLRFIGFGVADLAFAIYGAALGLVPAILVGLIFKRETLKHLKVWALLSAIFGFVSAWVSAIMGKTMANGDLVFWAPVFGMLASSIILATGLILLKVRNRKHTNLIIKT